MRWWYAKVPRGGRTRRWLPGLALAMLGCSLVSAPAVGARPTMAGTPGTVWVTNQHRA